MVSLLVIICETYFYSSFKSLILIRKRNGKINFNSTLLNIEIKKKVKFECNTNIIRSHWDWASARRGNVELT